MMRKVIQALFAIFMLVTGLFLVPGSWGFGLWLESVIHGTAGATITDRPFRWGRTFGVFLWCAVVFPLWLGVGAVGDEIISN
jgi:hypothetical protein